MYIFAITYNFALSNLNIKTHESKVIINAVNVSTEFGDFASENCNNKCRLRLFVKDKLDTSMKRSLIRPFAQVEDINACLYITFQQSFENVDITIRDKEGNEVVNDQQTAIYEGHVITIPQSNGYPYSIVITSSMVNIQGEIVLED